MKRNENNFIGTRIPKEFNEKLKKLASEKLCSKSDVLRQILREHLEKNILEKDAEF